MNTFREYAMDRGMRVALLLVILAGLLFAWRITHLMQADAALSKGQLVAALGWHPDHPEALLQLAESQVAGKQLDAAAATARHLLQVEPTDGRGYRVLAQVAAAQGRDVQALALYKIAARRAPRDLQARAWLAQHALEHGNRAEALVQIDDVLTLSPGTGPKIFPVLLTLSADTDFAEALADMLNRRPTWRPGMLAVLRQAGADDQEAAEQVLDSLQRKGGFDATESAARIDALLASGRWGEAHARWAGPIVAAGKPLPVLFNGGFAQDPSGSGFDWHMPPTPGVILDFEQGQGDGRVLHARFLGRRVAGAYLQHPLLLAPGSYRLQFRQRSSALRSDYGQGWALNCVGGASTLVASGAPINGSRDWQPIELQFEIQANNCQGQWLRFGNAGEIKAGQIVSGELWLADIAILRDHESNSDKGDKGLKTVARTQ